MTNKEKYREFCQIEKDIPIFSKDWWLDAVCGEYHWEVILIEKGGNIVASMPYMIKKELLFTLITMPPLTQTLGPYIKYPKGQKYYKKLSWEKEIMTLMIQKLPKFDSFNQAFYPKITNWLPFYWQGFQQSTRYTYRIKNIPLNDLERSFETDIRRRNKKAKQFKVEVFEGEDIQKFYELNIKTFNRKGIKIPYSLEFISNLYAVCKEHDACKMYFAKDIENDIIAVNFLVYDANTVYYLMGGMQENKKELGGMDMIQIESIKFAMKNNKTFDFEGSMIESIEKYFRSFGAIQKPYFQIYKTNSNLWKLKHILMKVIKK
jgi:lipid II:glycine glycyltransferase (peptidoglycan interpeptide bridge formation enzyme)